MHRHRITPGWATCMAAVEHAPGALRASNCRAAAGFHSTPCHACPHVWEVVLRSVAVGQVVHLQGAITAHFSTGTFHLSYVMSHRPQHARTQAAPEKAMYMGALRGGSALRQPFVRLAGRQSSQPGCCIDCSGQLCPAVHDARAGREPPYLPNCSCSVTRQKLWRATSRKPSTPLFTAKHCCVLRGGQRTPGSATAFQCSPPPSLPA